MSAAELAGLLYAPSNRMGGHHAVELRYLRASV
jgi:hypothetical protein